MYDAGRVVIPNVTWVTIVDEDSFWGAIAKAYKMRTVDKNAWNERSSRSHCIYRLRLVNSSKTKEGILNFVDLAGSERSDPNHVENDISKVTDAIQKRKLQTEANFINKSLTTLGRIVRLIGDKTNPSAIPYRESKLTRLLQVLSLFFNQILRLLIHFMNRILSDANVPRL